MIPKIRENENETLLESKEGTDIYVWACTLDWWALDRRSTAIIFDDLKSIFFSSGLIVLTGFYIENMSKVFCRLTKKQK